MQARLSDRRVSIKNRLALAAAAGMLGVGSLASAQVTVWAGGSGNWNPGAWSAGMPNSTAATAVIDGNTGLNNAVTVNGSFTVGTLQIAVGDSVTVPNGSGLTIANSLSVDGPLSFIAGANLTDLTHNGGTLTIGGSNVLSFSGANARFLGSGTVNNLTLISGGGQIGVNALTFFSTGSIVASSPTTELVIDPANNGGTAGFTNGGTLLASGGTLTFTGNGAGFFNIGAICRADAGSQIRIVGSADLRNGTFSTVGNGTVAIASGNVGNMTDITNAGNITVENNAQLNLGATFTNNGSVNLNAGLNFADINIGGASVTLAGTGVLNLSAANSRVLGGSGTLVNGSTIQGQGQLGVNSVTIINNGLVQATTGTMSVDPVNSGGTAGFVNNGTLLANGAVLSLSGNGSGFFNNQNRIIAGSTDVHLANNVDVRNGTLSSSGAGIVRVPSNHTANLTNVTTVGNLTVDNNSALNLGGTLTNTGTVNLSPSANFADINVGGASVTLAGAGVINMNSQNARLLGGFGTLVNSTTIQGQGQVGSNNITIINNSLIQATTGTMSVDPANNGTGTAGFVNNGTLLANGAVLSLSGNGAGFFNNQSRIIAGSTDVHLANSVDVRNGTLSSSGVGIVRVPAGHTANLTNVTNVGNLTVDNNSILNLGGTLTNTGTVNLSPALNFADVNIGGASVTLAGSGVINMNSQNARLLGSSGTLINNTTIQGQGQIGINTINIINNSLIQATTGTVTIDPVNNGAGTPGFVNNGSLLANGAVLSLSGNGAGFFNNQSRIIAGSSDVHLANNVDVRNGTLSSSGAGIVRVPSGHTANLTNVTNVGNLTVDNNSQLNLGVTLTNTGTVNLNAVANPADINVGGSSVALAGAGVINMNAANARMLGGAGTIVNNTTIQGQGNIGVNTINVINNNLIQATAGTMSIDPVNNGAGTPGFVNNGTLAAAGGVLQLSGNGAGFFAASSGTIAVASNGTLQTNFSADVRAGIVTLNGFWDATNSSGTSVTRFRGNGALSVSNSALVKINAGGGTAGTSTTTSLSVATNGRLDITDHAVAVDYTGASPLSTIRSQIATAYTAGTWGGAGITSSSAAAAAATPEKTGIGYAEASQLFSSFPANFNGVSVDSTSVLLQYTLYGDANLDKIVNISDFARLAAKFNQPANWIDGDFNYSGTTDISDFSLLAANFNKSLPADLPRGAAVPEPSVLSIGALALTALHRRRRIPAL